MREFHPIVRAILHIDMDAFFASVEQRDDPSLRGLPVIVGGPAPRGVVAAASYEVRPFGVRSAMSTAEALRRCPHAVIVRPRHDHYADVSDQVFAIFARYTPLIEALSLDEAFLDVTASRALHGDGAAIARAIKQAIRDELGLTASAGVAPCKFAAKIASDLRKPDGLVEVPADDVAGFLAALPVERMWGIGPRTAPRCRAYGLATIGDLARADPALLEQLLGSWGAHVQALARGDDERPVVPDRAAKSIGAEETFDRDIGDREELLRALLAQSGRVARRLLRNGLCGRVVVVKLKYADFTLRTRRATLAHPVDDTDSIFAAARELFAQFDLAGGQRARLTGVAVADLQDGPPPRTLFPDPRLEKRRAVEQVTARLAARFGRDAVVRASLLEPDGGARPAPSHGGISRQRPDPSAPPVAAPPAGPRARGSR